jgi:hypothetical protein
MEGALRVDPNVVMDPTWVANPRNPRFFDYLRWKGYTFKEVLAEKGASRPGLGEVAKVLEPGGTYAVEAPVDFVFYRSSRITKAWDPNAEVVWLPFFSKAVQTWARGLDFQVEGGLPRSADAFAECIRTAAGMTKGEFENVADGPSMAFPFYGNLRLSYRPPHGSPPSTSLSSVPGR